MVGKHIFDPDDSHLHHRLIERGLSHKSVVWTFYLITLGLSLIAVLFVHIRNKDVGLFFIVLGAVSIICVRKLGYFEYIAYDKVYGWLKDLSDEAGFTRNRRTFLSLQIDMNNAGDVDELWQHVTRALEMISFDDAAFYLNAGLSYTIAEGPATDPRHRRRTERRVVPYHEASIGRRKTPPQLRWTRRPFILEDVINSRCYFRLELPLLGKNKLNYGNLVLLKDLRTESLNPYILRRVEQLRRTVTNALEKLLENAHYAPDKAAPEKAPAELR
jgi:UDP-GlcNAc:undecaprenyl-phosphate GlcNAc-1-phosphate transferase